MLKVLLTTLSKLGGKDTNYYYDSVKNKYIDGVSQQECGAKWFLSNEEIDKIIILGSNEVYSKNDRLHIDRFCDEYSQKNYFTSAKISDYEFFLYRLSQFVEGKGKKIEIEKIEQKIDEKRRDEIQNIVLSVLKEFNCEDEKNILSIISNKSVPLQRIIKEKIDADIKNNFVDESEYDTYLSKVSKYPEVIDIKEDETYERINQKISLLEEELNKTKNNNMSILSKEYFCLAHSRRIEAKIFEFMTYKLRKSSEESKVYQRIISRLRNANEKFIAEISAYKSSRLKMETDYARAFIYSMIPSDNIMKPLIYNKAAEISFIPLYKEDNSDNIEEIIEGIIGHSNRKNDFYGEVKLYIDVQGGNRTDGYVRNAILSILQNEKDSKISIKQIISTNYYRENFVSEIVDETKRYLISDLVSGMNAFVHYGKADIIRKYWDTVKGMNTEYSATEHLISIIEKIDDALSICDVYGFKTALAELKEYYGESDDKKDPFFKILEDGICKEYKVFLTNKYSNVDMIRWACEKDFIQQALTMLESLMPEQFFVDGVFIQAETEDEKAKYIDKYAKEYLKVNDYEKYKFEDMCSYMIKFDRGRLLPKTKEWTKTKDWRCSLLDDYVAMKNERNNINHAKKGDNRSGVTKIKEKIIKFINTYEQNRKTVKVPPRIKKISLITYEDIVKKAKELK